MVMWPPALSLGFETEPPTTTTSRAADNLLQSMTGTKTKSMHIAKVKFFLVGPECPLHLIHAWVQIINLHPLSQRIRESEAMTKTKTNWDKIACFKVKLSWTRGLVFVFSPLKLREAFKNKNNETYGIFHMLVDPPPLRSPNYCFMAILFIGIR